MTSNPKKDMIVSNFIKLIHDIGFNKVTLNDVAKKCGLTKSGLYYYFDSKEDLLLATMSKLYSEIFQIMEKELSRINDPMEKLKKYIELKVKVFTDEIDGIHFPHINISQDIFEEIEKFIFNSPSLVTKIKSLTEQENKIVENILKEIHPQQHHKKRAEYAGILSFLLDGYFHIARKISNISKEYQPDFFQNLHNPSETISTILLHGIGHQSHGGRDEK